MKQLYKILNLLLITALIGAKVVKAQEAPVPNVPPQIEVLPAPPMPPIKIIIDEQKWEQWGNEFSKKFDNKKWEEWGEKVGKSFEGFGEQFKNMDLASADYEKRMKAVNQKLKDIKIPKIPAMPEMPALPEMPQIIFTEGIFNSQWQLGSPSADAIEKIKKLTKSYAVNADDVLLIQNSYGKINVNTWNKNEIKVDVEIKAYAGDEETAQKLLDGVDISNVKAGNQISFKTTIEQNSRSNSWLSMSFWNSGSSDKQKVEVYYTVYMPAKNAINLKTNYTNVVLPNLSGDVTLNMNYGDLNAGDLLGKTNVKSNYSKLNLLKLDDVILSSNYGNINIVQSGNINASLNYCSLALGNLSGNAVIKMNYAGGFKIGSFDKDFKSLNINANYSNINLDFNNNTSFNFDISTSYASFKYNDNVTITSKSPSDEEKNYSSSKTYKGYYGKSPSGNVTIKSNYGGIRFN